MVVERHGIKGIERMSTRPKENKRKGKWAQPKKEADTRHIGEEKERAQERAQKKKLKRICPPLKKKKPITTMAR